MFNTSLIQFRALLARQQSLQQQHHKRIARRLHDEVSQRLTLLSLQLSLATLDQIPPENWAQKCKDWNKMALELGGILRDVTNELRPRILDDVGLVGALQWFANSCPKGILCDLTTPEDPVTLPPVAANEVFTLCREIVNDVFAPNGVIGVAIDLEQAPNLVRLQLRVLSTRAGATPLTTQALDALSIHERLMCLDGNAVVDEHPGKGFAVTVFLQATRHDVPSAALAR
ncbi:MAG TPA: histidine kinase [Verrucomicrobiae bacterium]|jgi:signal transduction histidine kinase|nr:histidine kinase [Verrucomicrobiae bacterium]